MYKNVKWNFGSKWWLIIDWEWSDYVEVIYYDEVGIVIGYWWWSKSMFMYGDGCLIVLIVTAMGVECFARMAMGAKGYYG